MLKEIEILILWYLKNFNYIQYLYLNIFIIKIQILNLTYFQKMDNKDTSKKTVSKSIIRTYKNKKRNQKKEMSIEFDNTIN